MRLDRKKGKIIAGIAGIAAVAVLTVVLILATVGAPDPDVVARVNGEKIMADDVAAVQARYLQYGMNLTPVQALEELIIEELVYQEAKHEGHLLAMEEAGQELHAHLGAANLTLEDLQVQLDSYEMSYEEYLEDFRRQLAIDDYMAAEVPVPEVTNEEAWEYYEDYRESYLLRYPDQPFPPFEQVQSEIVNSLSQEKQQEAMLILIEELKDKADITYYP